MPRNCTICLHPKRKEIDEAILDNEPYRRIASRCDVSEAAIRRHKAEHLKKKLIAASQARAAADIVSGNTLLDRLKDVHLETVAILREARKIDNSELALKAIVRLEKQLELEGRLLGELRSEGGSSQVVKIELVYVNAPGNGHHQPIDVKALES